MFDGTYLDELQFSTWANQKSKSRTATQLDLLPVVTFCPWEILVQYECSDFMANFVWNHLKFGCLSRVCLSTLLGEKTHLLLRMAFGSMGMVVRRL
jgi:hypothetical protein